MTYIERALVLGLLLSVSGCFPSTESTLPPRFTLLPEASGLQRLDPPGIGSGNALFHLELAVLNPNPFALRFSGIDGAFFLNGRRAAAGLFETNSRVAAESTQLVALDIEVPLEESLLSTVTSLVAGDLTDYQLIGQTTISYNGFKQRLPETEVFAARWAQALEPQPPSFIFNSGASVVSEVYAQRATIDVALIIENPGPLGYRFIVPDLQLLLNGEPLGEVAVLAEDLRAFETREKTVRFEVATSSLSIITANELRRLTGTEGSLSVSLTGSLRLELAGFTSQSAPIAVLSSGFLR